MDNIFIMDKLRPDVIIKNWDILYKLYVANNDDVQLSGYIDYNNSLRHFIKFGYKENRSFGITLNNDALIKLRKNKIVKNSIFTSNNDSNSNLFEAANSIINNIPEKKDISNFERNYIIKSNKNCSINNKSEETINQSNLDKHKFVDLLEFNEDDFTIESSKIFDCNDILSSEESEVEQVKHNNTEERSIDNINIIEEFKN